MKSIYKKQKRNYTKPVIDKIILDNEILIFMASSGTPPGDPETTVNTEHFSINPFKLPNL